MTKKIEWVKWRDPFIEAEEQEDLKASEHAHLTTLFKTEEQRLSTYKGTYMYGPLGIMPLTDYALPSRQYNLWVGHTNFNVSKPVKDKLESIEGVELVRVFTRYRFWLGVGIAFDHEKVKSDIENALCKDNPTEPVSKQSIIDIAKSRYKFWSIFRKKGQETHEIVGSQSKSEFLEKIKPYKTGEWILEHSYDGEK